MSRKGHVIKVIRDADETACFQVQAFISLSEVGLSSEQLGRFISFTHPLKPCREVEGLFVSPTFFFFKNTGWLLLS